MRARIRLALIGPLAAAAVLFAWMPRQAPAAETYGYDSIGRLTDVVYDSGSSLRYTYDGNGNLLSVVASAPTGVDAAAPLRFLLGPCLPNPGSGPRSIALTTATRGVVTLRVFDAAGRVVSTLFDRTLNPGRYVAHFSGDGWGGGVYFYRLSLGGHQLHGRMVVLR
jgi:YD repeat-containing protein